MEIQESPQPPGLCTWDQDHGINQSLRDEIRCVVDLPHDPGPMCGVRGVVGLSLLCTDQEAFAFWVSFMMEGKFLNYITVYVHDICII